MEDLKAKREALDLAIADIKSTIHTSKSKMRHTPQSEEENDIEPVWIMSWEKMSQNSWWKQIVFQCAINQIVV
jgi:hypothetical protein